MAVDNNDETLWGWQSKIRNSAERDKHVLETDFHSDVTFRVGPHNGKIEDIKAHKLLLATGSTIFDTMFFGPLAETKSIIPITDIDPEAFRILLRYLYQKEIGPFNDTTAFPTLYAAKKYGLPILKNACEKYLRYNVTVNNCLAWFAQAEIYDEPTLAEVFLSTIDSQGPLVFASANFLEMDNKILEAILSRDSFKVREVDVYNAVVRWARHECAEEEIEDTGVNMRGALGNALFQVRFPIMTFQEVALGPVKLGLLLDEEIEQLRCWFANETLPESFNTTRRHISAELHIARFGGGLDGWTYAAGRANGIKLCIASMTDKTNRNVDSASVSVNGIGFYLSSVAPSVQTPIYRQFEDFCHYCGARSTVSRALPSPAQPSPLISLKVYVEDGETERELEEYRQTLYPPGGQMGDSVWKLSLSKPVPLELHQRYTISAEITGIQKSYYGTNGQNSVTMPTSSGDLNVTVQFSSVLETNGNLSGNTSVSFGQLPEFYFEVIG